MEIEGAKLDRSKAFGYGKNSLVLKREKVIVKFVYLSFMLAHSSRIGQCAAQTSHTKLGYVSIH